MVQINFDANQVAPNTGMEPVPEGWYNVAIKESELKPTKDGTGAYLQLILNILDGQFMNKPIFVRLNIQNTNQQAVDIAYGELSAICHACGMMQVADSSMLHGIPFQVRVTVSPAKGEYDASNNVKGYKDAAGNEPGKAPVASGAPANFGGTAAPEQAGSAPAFGAQQAAPATGQAGWGGQPAAAAQPAQNPAPQGGGFDPATGQPVQQAAAPATGGFDPATGQPIAAQPAQGGFDPATGQPLQATQPAQQQAAPAGNAGWTQPAQGQGGQPAQGGAPWGANGQPAQ